MTLRPTTCALCRAPITQAVTGRPRLYCGENHRSLAAALGRLERMGVARRLHPRDRP